MMTITICTTSHISILSTAQRATFTAATTTAANAATAATTTAATAAAAAAVAAAAASTTATANAVASAKVTDLHPGEELRFVSLFRVKFEGLQRDGVIRACLSLCSYHWTDNYHIAACHLSESSTFDVNHGL